MERRQRLALYFEAVHMLCPELCKENEEVDVRRQADVRTLVMIVHLQGAATSLFL